MASTSPRRKHRKRFSLSHLSSDTSATLPEYSSVTPPWRSTPVERTREREDLPYDRPPDYPQSADEADEDTDSSVGSASSHISPLPLSPTHQRRFRTPTSSRRRPSHRRSTSASTSTDPFLDSLLERSVHALEMSNALLQSSMSTHTSLSTFLASEPSTAADHALEASARGLSSRISSNRSFHESWMDDIDSISRGVDDVLAVPDESKDAVSRSLPTSSLMHSRMRARGPQHRSSNDLSVHGGSCSALSSTTDLTLPDPDAPHLRLSARPPSRDQLVAPAPRAMTLYVESDADPSAISLPSTLGLRSSSSTFLPHNTHESHRPPDLSPPRAGPSTTSISKSPPLAIPRRKDQPASESSTPAYTLLSSFLSRRPSTSTASPTTSRKFPGMLRNRSTSARRASTSAARSPRASPERRRASTPRRPSTSAGFSDSQSLSRSPPPAPLQLSQTPEIRLAPALEELISRSSSESSSSVEQPVQSMQALRKILDDQPSPSNSRDTSRSTERVRQRKEFLPRSPNPAPTLGTSNATASVSRLFTKGLHANSTRPRSPPKHSALKGGSGSVTPRTPRSPAESGGWVVIPGVSSSGTSTPRRIQFAELPEPYSREQGSSGRGFGKDKGKGRARSRGKAGTGLSTSTGEESEEEPTWWQAWLGIDPAKDKERSVAEERVEAKIARWGFAGGRGFGAVDDWGV
ncbi:hypothetical protein DENSPDRAFT_39838 [Dentipellis sp. KUC8613]|nr:hypothetical protein DENSPDRAFT_39838 [Dentipellis sp. KUC8613]